MIVSHQHGFIFLKTRKTASTSTELALFPHCGTDDIITPLRASELTRRIGHHAQNHIRPAFALDPRPTISRFRRLEGHQSVDYHKHMRAVDVRAYVGENIWKSYYKFAFDRNIYDRQVSWFHYRTRKPHKKKRWPNFDSFLATSPEARVDNFEIYTIDGKLAVDFIGRYDRLQEDFDRVMNVLQLPVTNELPVAKAGLQLTGKSYREFYKPATQKLVESWYPGEIKLFGDRF